MRHFYVALALALAVSAGSMTSAGAQMPPVSQYEVQRQADGSLKVVPKVSPKLPTIAMPEASGANPNPADVFQQLRDQEFWVASDAQGSVRAVYVVPQGENPPETMLSTAGEGAVFTKLSGTAALSGLFPDPQEMTKVLSDLMTNAKNAVCGMPTRPTQFGTVVDISAGLGISGRIEFNATWDTAELCK
ncbi:hypothetical protein [Sinorhizobium fredii]|jgi:hypothetical protein|uniref:hypothetical protein n=1 Tax=Rhizobium fredii TaxID=380 RepID=UPI0004ACB113|nr:hypothetical protein [Sinorhizobium fredii]